MYEDINRKLEELKAGIQRTSKIDSKIKAFKQDEERLQTKLESLKTQLTKEDQDVKRFEKTNLTTIFYRFLGSYESQVEKERQEALAAKLKYDQCFRELEEAKYQLGKLTAEKLEYLHCSKDYQDLYQKKLQLLQSSQTKDAAKVMAITENIAGAKANLTEIQEAIDVGDKVLNCLSQVRDSLKSARGWGVWDMLGGGLISNLVKHSHIDKAKGTSGEVQNLLSQFKNELADIQITSDINIEISGFSKFADFFFDGLLADWFVQSKITSAQTSVDEVQEQVDMVIQKLNEMKDSVNSSIKNYQAELDSIMSAN